MHYLGDFPLSAIFDTKFPSWAGAPTTLAGSPVISVYKDNSTTQSTSGVTLTVDFDSVTGLNNLRVDLSSDGTFYSAGSNFSVVITTGTVGGVSVVGAVIAQFSINNRSPLRPATAGRTLVVDAAGLADANAVKVGPTGSGSAQTARDIGASVLLSSGTGTGQLDFTSGVVKANLAQILGTALTETTGLLAGGFKKFFNVASPTLTCLGIDQTGDNYTRLGAPAGASVSADIVAVKSDSAAIKAKTDNLPSAPAATGDAMALTALHSPNLESGTAQAGASGTITLRSGASAADNFYRSQEIEIYGGTGAGQVRVIASYVGSTKVATVDENWITNPDNTSTYRVKHRAPALTSGAVSNVITLVNPPGDSSGITSLLSRVPAALVSGRMDASVGAYQSGQAPLQPTTAGRTLDVSTTGEAGLDFDNIKDASGAHTLTNIRVPNVTLADTITTYTGDTPQTGDTFARIGAAGAGLTALGDTRIANLDATISSRTKPADTQAAVTTVTNLTNAPTSGDLTATMKASVTTAASSATPALSAAGVQAIWDALTSALTTTGSIGKWILDKLDVVLSTRLASSGYTAPPTVTAIRQEMDSNSTRLDAAVSSRAATGAQMDLVSAPNATAVTAIQSGLATSAALATAKTELDAVKAKTDLIPAAPAATGDIPTATQNADALLKRDMSAVSGESARSPLNALRSLRNKVSISAGTLTVTKEDDSTAAWTGAVTTDATADPIVTIDPA